MSEEELNIDGVDRTNIQNNHDENQMNSRVGDLSRYKDLQADDLIDAIISSPTDAMIPWEECMLPSNGLYYDWPDGMIKVRAMGQTAEKILATQRLAETGQSIDYLFKECCRFPDNFDPSELLLGDRMFLLYFLRGITHGNIYEFAVTCPNPECGATNTHQYDLNQLVDTVRTADPSLGKEPFRIDLPYLSESIGKKMWVEVKFLRAYDANDMLAQRRARRKAVGGFKSKGRMSEAKRIAQSRRSVNPNADAANRIDIDTTLDDNLERIIVSVMGVTDRFKIRAFVQKLHAKDTSAIREWLKEKTPKIDSTIDITCPDCGTEFSVELPITDTFFRPKNN